MLVLTLLGLGGTRALGISTSLLLSAAFGVSLLLALLVGFVAGLLFLTAAFGVSLLLAPELGFALSLHLAATFVFRLLLAPEFRLLLLAPFGLALLEVCLSPLFTLGLALQAPTLCLCCLPNALALGRLFATLCTRARFIRFPLPPEFGIAPSTLLVSQPLLFLASLHIGISSLWA